MTTKNPALSADVLAQIEEKCDMLDNTSYNEITVEPEPFLCTGRGLPFPKIPDDVLFSSYAFKGGRGGKSRAVRSTNQLSSRQQIARELLQAAATLDANKGVQEKCSEMPIEAERSVPGRIQTTVNS